MGRVATDMKTSRGTGKIPRKRSGSFSKSKGRNSHGEPANKRFKKGVGFSSKTGPRYPASLLKELNLPRNSRTGDGEEEGSEVGVDEVYEYEEGVPEEEAGKNRRFDDVDRLEYELPQDFEDEEIPEDTASGEEEDGFEEVGVSGTGKHAREAVLDEESDGEESGDGDGSEELEEETSEDAEVDGGSEGAQAKMKMNAEENENCSATGLELFDDGEDEDDDVEDDRVSDDDEERHLNMINDVTGNSARYVLGKKKRKREHVVTEAYEESEFNVNPSAVMGSRPITVEDLMSTLKDKPRFGALRRRMEQLERRTTPLQPQFRKVIQDRVERQAGYEKSKEDITKWQPLVKANREAPCLVFNKKPELPVLSIASLAAKFEPKTDLEKDIATLLKDNRVSDDTQVQASEALCLNKLSVEEVRERQEKLVKMRSLLFHHEVKSKRIKKIKSKTYHRLLQKTQKRKAESASALAETDPEAARVAAVKEEFRRAQERMTLKHKNTSRWAKRILKRGLQAHADDGVRDAIAEQLRTHTLLTKKIHSATMGSSDEESSSEDEEEDDANRDGTEAKDASAKKRTKILAKAKMSTLKALEGDEEAEIPTSGLFALPFMARAIEKKRKEAQDDAVALLKQLEEAEQDDAAALEEAREETAKDQPAGRLVFGVSQSSGKGRKTERQDDMLVERGSDTESGSDVEDDKSPRNASSGVFTISKDETKNFVEWERDQVGLMEHGATSLKTQATGIIDVGVAPSTNKRSSADAMSHPGVSTSTPGSRLQSSLNGDSGVTQKSAHSRLFGDKSSARKHGVDVAENRSDMKPEPLQASFASAQERKAEEGTVNRFEAESDDMGLAKATSVQQPSEARFVLDEEDEEDDEQGLIAPGSHRVDGFEWQLELIKRAFAGDDVEAEFEESKAKAVDEELPHVEGPVSLPGWGQWTDVQHRKGMPKWVLKEQAALQAKKEAMLRNRKDSKLRHVIISERMDRKAKKFTTQSLPFPFTSRETFERDMRMPIGRDFNTDKAFRNMIQPKEIKSAGVTIDPIKYNMPPSKTKTSTKPGKKA